MRSTFWLFLCLLRRVSHAANTQTHTRPLSIAIDCKEFAKKMEHARSNLHKDALKGAPSIPTPFLSLTITNSSLYAYIALHFSRLYLPKDVSLVLRSAQIPGKQDHVINVSATTFASGVEYGDVYTQPLFAKVFLLEMYLTPREKISHETNLNDSCFGFRIDKFFFSNVENWIAGRTVYEAICAKDNTEEAICYYSDSATRLQYLSAQPVARLLIQRESGDQAACTGWLLGQQGYLVTNHHCIANEAEAQATRVEFMANSASCNQSCGDWGACPGVVEAIATTLVYTSEIFDYTIVKPDTSVNLTDRYGFLRLSSSPSAVGDIMFIPQYPLYYGKRIAMSDDYGSSLTITGTNASGCSFSSGYSYTGDTQAGSSGSPIVSTKDLSVIGVHHCGSFCSNTGIPSFQIVQDLMHRGILDSSAIAQKGDNNAQYLSPYIAPPIASSAALSLQYIAFGTLYKQTPRLKSSVPAVTVDRYTFELSADAQISLDILSVEVSDDGTFHDLNSDCQAKYVDAILFLLDASGNSVAMNDDAESGEGGDDGSVSSRDPYIGVFLANGTYTAAVGSISSNITDARRGFSMTKDPSFFDCIAEGRYGPYRLQISSSVSLTMLSTPVTSTSSLAVCQNPDPTWVCSL